MSDRPESSRESLQTRLRQQEGVARLGEKALWGPPLQELFDLAADYLRELLEVDLSKVLEWHPDENHLLLRSGRGWKPGRVGSATEPDRRGSAGGYTMLTQAPVIVADLRTEDRFTPSDLLREHAAVSGLTVVIRGAYRPFGVLAAFTTAPRTFTQDDLHFLQGLANVLAASVQRAQSEQQTLRSETRFREMVDGLPIMVWMHSASGEQELVNRTMCEYFGVMREEMTGERWESLLHPSDVEAYKGEFLKSLQERRSFRAETRVRRADGEWRLLESRGEPRSSENGDFDGMVGASIDITEQRAAEDELKEADRRKNEFIALLGHELRNPLTPIASAAAVLEARHEELDGEQLRELASVLSRQSDYLTRVVNDLLDLSRIDRDMLTLQQEVMDLRAVVQQAVETIPQLREPGGISFAMDLPASPLPVCGDRVRLVQALTNVLDNAVKHTPEQSAIRLDARQEAGEIAVHIQDEGAGIDPAVLPRLFEPFERGAHELSAGLGLGLPLVKRVVELHGGRVEAHSEGLQRGSTFVICLPAESREPSPRADEDQPATARAELAEGLLLVEDHDDVAQALQAVLESLAQTVHRVDSGQRAIEAVRERRYALALIDVRLPDMSGFEVASELRELQADISLVGLSGFPASNFSQETTRVLDDYLLKPPSEADLQRVVDQVPQRR